MNGTEHSFPLPEEQAHLLDEVKETIASHPSQPAAERREQPNYWALIAFIVAGSALFTLWERATLKAERLTK